MTSKKYYTHIDGMRAFAVLSVLLFHLRASWLPGGFVGVDIFFVISGFVVSASVAHFRGSFSQFLSFFYSRRFARILPALLVCLLLTTVGTLLFVPQAWLSNGMDRVLRAALIGIANFSLIQSRNDYFNPKAEYNPFTHTWSLGVEEQFYLLFPLLFTLWLNPRFRTTASIFLGLLTAASLVTAHLITDISVNFYATQSRFWEISIGVLVFQISQTEWIRKFRIPSRVADIVVLFCLVAMTYALFITSSQTFPSLGTYLAVLSTALILLVLESIEGNLGQRFLSLPVLRKVGFISYSLYLYHWPVIVLMRWTTGLETYPTVIFATLLSFILAVLSYRFIEGPARNAKRHFDLKNWQIIVTGLVIIFVSIIGFRAIYKKQNIVSLSVTAQNVEDWDAEKRNFELSGCRAIIQHDVTDTKYITIKRQGECETNSKLPRLFVIGDSHAAAYMALLKQLVVTEGYEVQTKMNPACSLISFNGSQKKQNAQCQHFLSSIKEKILEQASPGDILFLPGLRVIRLNELQRADKTKLADPWLQMLDPTVASWREESLRAAESELRPYLDKGLKIVFEAPKPVFMTPAYRCADWFNRSNPLCQNGFSISRSKLLKYKEPIDAALVKVTKISPAISIWDPWPVLCPETPEDVCPMFHGAKPLFFDQDHLSGYGNVFLLPNFVAYLQKLGASRTSDHEMH